MPSPFRFRSPSLDERPIKRDSGKRYATANESGPIQFQEQVVERDPHLVSKIGQAARAAFGKVFEEWNSEADWPIKRKSLQPA
jgi:hypothetical protein